MRKPKTYAKALPIVWSLDKSLAAADLVIFRRELEVTRPS